MDFCIGISAGFLLGLVSIFVSVGGGGRDVSILVVRRAMSLLVANEAESLLHVFGPLLVREPINIEGADSFGFGVGAVVVFFSVLSLVFPAITFALLHCP
jgi:hypothetical protein